MALYFRGLLFSIDYGTVPARNQWGTVLYDCNRERNFSISKHVYFSDWHEAGIRIGDST